MMWALKATRSMMAATSLASVKAVPHSLNGTMAARAMEARSSLSVITWNSSSASFIGVIAHVGSGQDLAGRVGHE